MSDLDDFASADVFIDASSTLSNIEKESLLALCSEPWRVFDVELPGPQKAFRTTVSCLMVILGLNGFTQQYRTMGGIVRCEILIKSNSYHATVFATTLLASYPGIKLLDGKTIPAERAALLVEDLVAIKKTRTYCCCKSHLLHL
jgi:hypothetical protein